MRTAGELARYLESLDGAPAAVGPVVMRWGATLSVDPDSMERQAEWTK